MGKLLKRLAACLGIILLLSPCQGSVSSYGFEEKEGEDTAAVSPLTEEVRPLWEKNIRPEPEKKQYLTWAYRPTRLKEKPSGVNVLAPIWFYVMDKDGKGTPVLKDISEMGRKADFKGYIDQAHKQDTAVWAAVVSFTPQLSDALIHTPAYKKAFLDRLVSFVEDYKIDGINFDFENMNPRHKLDFTGFIKDCKEALKPLGAVISVDVTVKAEFENMDNWFQCYDHESLGQVVDYMAVMTYDEHKNHSGPGASASFSWVEEKLQGILEDVPSDKILLGVPFYSYDFRSQMENNDPDQLKPTWSLKDRGVITTTKAQIDQLLQNNSYIDLQKKKITVKKWLIKNQWDEDQGTYQVKFIDQNDLVHEIWYEEARSLSLKAQLVKKYHLAGAAVWQQDFGEGTMWEAIQKEMK